MSEHDDKPTFEPALVEAMKRISEFKPQPYVGPATVLNPEMLPDMQPDMDKARDE